MPDNQMNKNSQAGISMVEVLLASFLLVIGSLSMVGLIVASIATNNRNKIDSTQTMLANSVIEQIHSTIIGSATSSLTDCAGTEHTIETDPDIGNSPLDGEKIDFTEDVVDGFHMDYVINTPCTEDGALQGVYDIRWNVQIVGEAAGTPTNTYLLTIGSQMKNRGQGNMLFSAPVTLRVMSGNDN
jgi:hypothetical protein